MIEHFKKTWKTQQERQKEVKLLFCSSWTWFKLKRLVWHNSKSSCLSMEKNKSGREAIREICPTWEAQDAIERATLCESRGGGLTVLPQTLVGVNRGDDFPLSVLHTPLVNDSSCHEGRRSHQTQNEPTILQNWWSHCSFHCQKLERLPGGPVGACAEWFELKSIKRGLSRVNESDAGERTMKMGKGAFCSAGGTGRRLLGFSQWVIQLRGLRYLCWRGVDSVVTGGKWDR